MFGHGRVNDFPAIVRENDRDVEKPKGTQSTRSIANNWVSPAAGDEERAVDGVGRGSPAPPPPDYGIGGQASRRWNAWAYTCRRHYGGLSQNSSLFAPFGVFGRHTGVTAVLLAIRLGKYRASAPGLFGSKRRSD